jgi:Kef-type K+ transport system membrane component KefB
MTAAVGLFFILLNAICLQKIFRFFTTDGEMLFIGTMAYNLGASAVCTLIGFSPMIGSYFAGLSLSVLPSRHQIEHKISSLRGYGHTQTHTQRYTHTFSEVSALVYFRYR